MVSAFRLKAYTQEDVPTTSEAAKAALELAEDIRKSWSKGKLYKFPEADVQTYNKRIEGDFWMSRVSRHKDIDYDTFRKWIFENHTENEVKYIPLLDSFKLLEDPVEGHPGWRSILVHYKFPKFFDDREMTVWIAAIEPDAEKKQFVVVSLPSDRDISPGVTEAEYCSVEVVTQTDDGVEWIMAQASDAKGNIPRWIQDRSVTASVVEDVPSFIKWAKEQK